jgi:Cdc6-like AAA superfamily ATPase
MANADDARWWDLALEAGKVFTPNTPINERDLFAGRKDQVRRIVDAVNQKGQHAVLYGERGVGKTSLSNVLSTFFSNEAEAVLAPRVNCDSTDTFDSVWRKVFDQINLTRENVPVGFARTARQTTFAFGERLDEGEVGPDTVRKGLTLLAQHSLPILIIDEFDRLSEETRQPFADTIKSLSDHAVGATVVLVGVADSVEQLVKAHESVQRSLVQIQMPLMPPDEIESIVRGGAEKLGMTVDDAVPARIAKLAQGLPHYAHLLSLEAARSALDNKRMNITRNDVGQSIKSALESAQQTIIGSYTNAIRSARKDNLFEDVLLSCSLAETNELGFFRAQDVREPMRRITHKDYDIPSFAQHLNEFCDDKRGPILRKSGTRKLFRYRFIDALLRPFVIMRGVANGKITPDDLD